MPKVFLSSVQSPIGPFFILERGGDALMVTSSLDSIVSKLGHHLPLEEAPTELSEQLGRGFVSGDFSVPFAWDYVRGSFERRVLSLLCHVRAGETTSYGALAELAGSPGAARAVGGAMRKNPLALVVPCHRVLPSTGKVGSYSAGGPSAKEWLLRMEGAFGAGRPVPPRAPSFSAVAVQ